MRIGRARRRTLPEVLAERVTPCEGDLVEMLRDAVLAQEMRWIEDQMAGRPSTV